MKRLAALILLSVTAGCVTLHGVPSSHPGDGSSGNATTSAAPMSVSPVSPQAQSIGPHLVLPTTGGAPIMAIQLGGNIYQPLTGGPPVIGIRVSP
jgi:hypothetical protein